MRIIRRDCHGRRIDCARDFSNQRKTQNSVYGAEAVVAAGSIGLVVDLQESATVGYQNPLEAKGEVLHLMGVPVPYLVLAKFRRPNLVTLVELAVQLQQRRKEPWVTVAEKVR